MGEHFAGVGKGLNSAVTAYNRAVGSLESRVLVTARRFVDMGVVGAGEKELAHPATVDTNTRALQAPELGAPVLELSLLPGVGDLGDASGWRGSEPGGGGGGGAFGGQRLNVGPPVHHRPWSGITRNCIRLFPRACARRTLGE